MLRRGISEALVRSISPGTIVRLAKPEGEFVMPDPPPQKVLFLVAGSGVTPVMAMLRTMDRRGTMPDVVMNYSSPDASRRIFGDGLTALASKHDALTLQLRDTDHDGTQDLADLDQICPDWRERQTWACGPGPMLDAATEHWEAGGLWDSLHLERFAVPFAGDDADGGTVSFQNTGKNVEADGATTLLEAGEQAGVGMPYACRVGICHACTLTLVDGAVKDLRTGEIFNQPNVQIQTCVTAPMGGCTLNI